MKNRIIIVIIALIIVLVIITLNLKRTVIKISDIEDKSEIVNEINTTKEIQSTEENVIENTSAIQEENIEKTKEKSIEKTMQIIEKENTKESVKNTQEKVIESPKQEETKSTTQTSDEINTPKKENQKEEKKETPVQENQPENKIQENSKCTDSEHEESVGNSDKWFNSYDEAIIYYNDLINRYSYQVHNGEITSEEYYKLCPYGYEIWSCPYCGKWTLNYYKRK